jgi:predicted HicB family RNase H-like nuclease
MSALLEYKGYHAVIDDFDQENGIFHGRVVDIRDVIDFQATSGPELIQAFHESIDDYLDWAAAEGFEPEKPFSGQFTVRISPQLHRRVAVAARAEGKSLNQWLADLMAAAAPSPVSTLGSDLEPA